MPRLPHWRVSSRGPVSYAVRVLSGNARNADGFCIPDGNYADKPSLRDRIRHRDLVGVVCLQEGFQAECSRRDIKFLSLLLIALRLPTALTRCRPSAIIDVL